MRTYKTDINIDNIVSFKPMARHCEKFGIEGSIGLGRVTGVRFTKAKVFYDIIDDYYGFLFRDVDSVNVKKGNFQPPSKDKISQN